MTAELQTSKRGQRRLQDEQEESEREIQELKQQNSRFKSALQVRGATRRPCSSPSQSADFSGSHRGSSAARIHLVHPFHVFQLSQADKVTIDNLQRKVRSLESQLRSRAGEKERRDEVDEEEKERRTPRT